MQDQQSISNFLDGQIVVLDSLVDGRKRQIELLLERRQALITAAVTGQLEIPGVAA